jgi:hypothetical protein
MASYFRRNQLLVDVLNGRGDFLDLIGLVSNTGLGAVPKVRALWVSSALRFPSK